MEPLLASLLQGNFSALLQGGMLVMMGGVILRHISGALRSIWFWILAQCFTYVEVPNSVTAFEAIQMWVDSHPRAKKYRLLSVSGWRRPIQRRDLWDPGEIMTSHRSSHNTTSPPAPVFSLAPGNHFLWHKGRFVWLSRIRYESTQMQSIVMRELWVIRVLGRNTQVARDLVHEAINRATAPEKDFVQIMTWQSEGWTRLYNKPPRPLDSIVLPIGEVRGLVEDCTQFFNSRAWYEELGIPYRRGYLFYGKPGTGKTSLVFSLAGSLGRDLYVISLNGGAMGMHDGLLQHMVSQIPEGSLLLLEDVDCCFDNRETPGVAKVSFSGLLNVIDGVCAGENRLLFMTTNHVDRLDTALIRAGRVDRRLEFGSATWQQAIEQWERFFPNSGMQLARQFADQVEGKDLVMADLQAHLLLYRGDDVAAASTPVAHHQHELPAAVNDPSVVFPPVIRHGILAVPNSPY